MSTITWLHLSDLHFRTGEDQKTERMKWDEDIVLRELLKDVQERIRSDGLRPDFVMVSGDIAFQSAPEEYALATQFFDDLLEATGLGKEQLCIVPGNHDVDRKSVTRGAAAISASLDSREAIAEVLGGAEDRRLIFRKFNQYADFVKKYFEGHFLFDDERYFHVQNLALEAGHLAVLCLNSAWLAYGGEEDRARLALGERQVRPALEAAKDADLRIALLHHPFEWFYEFDRNDCEALLTDGCGFILHGHLHRTGVLSLQTPDAGAMIIAAGACYESRDYPNSYNLVELDLGAGQGTVHLRRYSDERGGFYTKDVMTYRNVDDGRYDFRLPSKPAATPGKRRRRPAHVTVTPTVDPALLEESYLRRVVVSCNALPLAVIDPRAVERTRQQTMDLLAVYVALDTETQVTEEEGEQRRKRRRPERLIEPGRETRPLSALEAAALERRMVLLGDPGSGKSTFANFLALCLAGERVEGEGKWLERLHAAWTYGALLPLRVTLREFAASEHCDGTAAGLWGFVEETLADENLAEYAPLLKERLFGGGVMVMFDGLDEVAEPKQRRAVLDAVADFTATHGEPTNRYLVTCRGYAYQEPKWQVADFTAHSLAPFKQDQIDDFIRCWYEEICHLGWKSSAEAEELTHRLQAATRRPDLLPLASNPLQLTMMASLHFSWGSLPEDRVELYQEMVRLLLVRWQEGRLGVDVGVTRIVSTPKLESGLEQLAWDAHHTQESPEGTANICEARLREILKSCVQDSWDRAGELLSFIKERAGLLIERETGFYTFPHRSYQEYLAGCYLAVQPDFPDQAASRVRENYSQWREVALWAVGVMARLKKMIYAAVAVVEALCPHEITDGDVSEDHWRAASLAGEALREIGLEEVRVSGRHEGLISRVQNWLVALMERNALTPGERAVAGDVLAKLGDPRPGVGVVLVKDARPDLPNMEFCYVPPGPFWMGEGDDEHLNECLDYGYWVGRYPVTNAQFRAFVEAGGYGQASYWEEAKAAGNWKDGRARHLRWTFEKEEPEEIEEWIDGPADPEEPFHLPNHPVVQVTWYEVLAFTRWLTHRLSDSKRILEGCAVRLASEAEWEKAARGGLEIPEVPIITGVGEELRVPPDQVSLRENSYPKARYPWGDKADPNKANYDETGIGATSAVGCFPDGASPYGCLDMAGNVWEWTRSIYRGYPYRPKDGREDLKAGDDVLRVLRGGSFYGSGDLRPVCLSLLVQSRQQERGLWFSSGVVPSYLWSLNLWTLEL